MTDIVFREIAFLLLGAAAIGMIGSALRQPVIVSFIAVGILAAATFDRTHQTAAQIEFLAELGVAVLLFLVGLKLDWRLVRTLGPVALATGLGQVLFTAGIGYLIGIALGLDPRTSLYVAIALTFSSTIIIVKLLSDKRELETLHGRIALGFLIVQDIVVVLAMVVLSTLGVGAEEGRQGLAGIATIVGSLAATLVLLVVFVRYLADPLVARLARSPELLVIAALGWAAAAAAVGDLVGLGKELGGLVAGVSLGSTAYREMISARLSALRDFLLLFFFLSIGASLDLSTLGQDLSRAIVFSLFVLIGNPLIVLVIMAWMGYRARTGFLAGLTVAQISEFSLIFMAMGLSLGHVQESAIGLVTLVGLVTIAISVYMITYSEQLYRLAAPFLKPFDFGWKRETADEDDGAEEVDFIVFGLGRFGGQILRRLNDDDARILGVDIDPAVLRAFAADGFKVRQGDVTEPEFWDELPLSQARWIIIALPLGAVHLTESDPGESFLTAVRMHGFGGQIAMTVRSVEEARRLKTIGRIDLVLHPFDDAARDAVSQIRDMDEDLAIKEKTS
jgi:Kef-type K+ transport system membrane component KefB